MTEQTWIVRIEATIKSAQRPDPDDFQIDFNNNLPYYVVDESVEVQEDRG